MGDSARAVVTTLVAQPDATSILDSGVGPAPLRRLVAFYVHAEARSVFTEATLREDIVWVNEHLPRWISRQEQAQRDAREVLTMLQTVAPLPAIDEPRMSSRGLSESMRQLRAMPDHWINQPWSNDLFGRWTEDLSIAVTAARQWLVRRGTTSPTVPRGAVAWLATDPENSTASTQQAADAGEEH